MLLEARSEDTDATLLGRAHAYWDRKCGGRAMPSRADIDPAEITDLLPNIILFDIVQPEGRLQIRLMGTELCMQFGADFTGRFLDEIDFGETTGKILKDYADAAKRAEPSLTECRFRRADMNVYYNSRRGIFPLSSDGVTVDKLMAVLDFSPFQPRFQA